MTSINDDGNLLGRFLAFAVLGLAIAGVHKLSCGDGSCPLMSAKGAASCCAGAEVKSPAPAALPAAPKKAASKPAVQQGASGGGAGDSKVSAFVEMP